MKRNVVVSIGEKRGENAVCCTNLDHHHLQLCNHRTLELETETGSAIFAPTGQFSLLKLQCDWGLENGSFFRWSLKRVLNAKNVFELLQSGGPIFNETVKRSICV